MDNVCRLCSNESQSTVSVFGIANNDLIVDMISIICPIIIKRSDHLPKEICGKCLTIVADAFELRKKCIESENYFRIEFEGISNRRESISNDSSSKISETPTSKSQARPSGGNKRKIERKKQTLKKEQQVDSDDSNFDENDSDYDESPPSKKNKSRSVRNPNPLNRKMTYVLYKDLNKKVKEFFEEPVKRGARIKCKICGKEYAGDTHNLKDHLSRGHEEIARKLGLKKRSEREREYKRQENSRRESLATSSVDEDFEAEEEITSYEPQVRVKQEKVEVSAEKSVKIRKLFDETGEKSKCMLCKKEFDSEIADLQRHLANEHKNIYHVLSVEKN